MSPFLFILFVGLTIRLFLVGNPGFVADISFWKSWSLAAIDHGIVWTTQNTNINYPPAFIYLLWLMGKIYSFFGDPHNYNLFWRENNFPFLLAAKTPAILSDLLLAILLFWFFSRQKEEVPPKEKNFLPLLISSLFFLHPVVILDSALWGQVESFGLLFTLSSLLCLFYHRPLLASFFFTTGTLMKLQNIIYLPLFFFFIFRTFSLKILAKSLTVSALTFFLLTFPFLWENQMKQVLYLLTVNSDYFPWLSLNAHNLWWIVAKGKGMQVSDKITVLGILNAKTFGLFLFSSFYFLSIILLWKKPSFRNLLLSFTLAIFAFFLFTTQSHERYSYPVLLFLLLLYPFLKEKKILFSPTPKYFWTFYLLLSAAIFFNIHTGLIFNYPKNGFGVLTRLTTLPLTLFNSYLLIFLFFALLPLVFSQIPPLFFLFSLFSFLALTIFSHFPYFLQKKVSLTFFKPVAVSQDYGSLQVNKSVDSAGGWKKWNRLSNNYFFYRQGFGTHANSRLLFDLNKKFRLFTTDFGIDTEAGTPASVIFKIYGDGKKLFESEKMGRFDFPGHTEVDISGMKFLELVVEDAQDGINFDHADWLNPVLYR